MKKIYLSFLCVLFTGLAFAQSTAWMAADSAASIAKPGSGGMGSPVWSIGSMPLAHNGTDYTTMIWNGGGTNIMMDHAYFYDFGLSVPTNATITGVEVIMKRAGCNGGAHTEDTIMLAYNGAAIGTSVTDTMPPQGSLDTFGSSSDMWGNALTPAMVNHYSFGIFYDTRAVGICTIVLQDCRVKVHYQTTTGIAGTAESKAVRIYPNPATSEITIESASESYSVTDQTGRVVLQGKMAGYSTRLNVTTLPAGLYFVRSGNAVAKFVKQ